MSSALTLPPGHGRLSVLTASSSVSCRGLPRSPRKISLAHREATRAQPLYTLLPSVKLDADGPMALLLGLGRGDQVQRASVQLPLQQVSRHAVPSIYGVWSSSGQWAENVVISGKGRRTTTGALRWRGSRPAAPGRWGWRMDLMAPAARRRRHAGAWRCGRG